MIEIHGGWRMVERPHGAAGPLVTACCGKHLEDLAAPALVLRSLDYHLVSCQGDPLLRSLMEAMTKPIDPEAAVASSWWPLLLHDPHPIPDPRIGIRILGLAIPQLRWWEYDGQLFYTAGGWLRLEGGILDIGIVRDFAEGFGERWRPWKRHLHRLGPRVWRLFGWRPLAPALDLHLVRDSTLEARNDFSLFAEEFGALTFVGIQSLRDQPIDMSAGSS